MLPSTSPDCRVHQHEAVGRGAAQRDPGRGVVVGASRHESGRALAQQARLGQLAGDRFDVLAEELAVDARDRRLVRRAQHVAGVDLGVERVEDRRLDRAREEVLRMAAEELVKRVLAGDVDRQPAAATSGPAPHLLEARDRSGERHADRGVELADVDPELQRVGRDDPEQVAVREAGLDLLALGGRVAGAVRGDALGQLRIETVAGVTQDQLDPLARLHEADRPHAGGDEIGEHLGGLVQDRRA